MLFKKKSLEFLKVFQVCPMSNEQEADKLQIISKEGKVYFSLMTPTVKLIKEEPCTDYEEISMSISLSKFNTMMTFCKDDDDISISAEGKIKFGSNSEYTFETFDFNIDEFNDTISSVVEGELIEIKDLSKIDKVAFSIGTEPELACLAFQDNNFVSYKSNTQSNAKTLSYTKTDNEVKDNFFLPLTFFKLYSIYKFTEISFKKLSENSIYLEINGIKIYMAVGDYSIPYIFDEGIRAKFDHTQAVSIDKEILRTALSRIKVLNQATTYNRVFIYFNSDNTIKVEIKDECKGFETVPANIANTLYDFYIVVSVVSLFEVLSNIPTEKIIIKLENNDDLATMKITDEKETQYHILTLTKKYDN